MATPPPPPAPVPAPKPPPPPKVVIPDPVFNEKDGKLLHGTRYWPTEVWKSPWSLPRYRNSAAALAVFILAGAGLAAYIGEFSDGSPSFARALRLLIRAVHSLPGHVQIPE